MNSWGGDILSATILHISATVKPNLLEAVWTAGNYIEEHYDPVNSISCNSGYFELPNGSGLGVSPQEDRVGQLFASFD